MPARSIGAVGRADTRSAPRAHETAYGVVANLVFARRAAKERAGGHEVRPYATRRPYARRAGGHEVRPRGTRNRVWRRGEPCVRPSRRARVLFSLFRARVEAGGHEVRPYGLRWLDNFLRIFIVKSPAHRIFVDVTPNAIEIYLIADNVVIIIALPQPLVKSGPRHRFNAADIFDGGG